MHSHLLGHVGRRDDEAGSLLGVHQHGAGPEENVGKGLVAVTNDLLGPARGNLDRLRQERKCQKLRGQLSGWQGCTGEGTGLQPGASTGARRARGDGEGRLELVLPRLADEILQREALVHVVPGQGEGEGEADRSELRVVTAKMNK